MDNTTNIRTADAPPGSLERMVSCWRREAQKAREHATKWLTADNRDGRPNAPMAEVCTMRAMTLEACANHLEEVANI